MLHSSLGARIVAVLVGLFITPIAMGLLSVGGFSWLTSASRYTGGFGDSNIVEALRFLLLPSLAMLAGTVLLLLVVATGFWSSLGLLATAIPAILPTLLALAPGLYLVVQPAMRWIPLEWTDSMTRGATLPLYWMLFGMGLALLWQRSRPPVSAVMPAVLGAIGAPVLLLAAAFLLADGVNRGLVWAMRTFEMDIVPLAVVEVVAAGLLIIAAALMVRWSPFAFVLPALVLVVVTVVAILPVGPGMLFGVLPVDMAAMVMSFLYFGTGGALAAIMLAFTGVILAVRRRMRLLQRVPALG